MGALSAAKKLYKAGKAGYKIAGGVKKLVNSAWGSKRYNHKGNARHLVNKLHKPYGFERLIDTGPKARLDRNRYLHAATERVRGIAPCYHDRLHDYQRYPKSALNNHKLMI